jgi:outer membrane lipoprotein-sorting protein
MTDEERTAKDLRDLALSIRAPRSVSSALDRAAAHATGHPTSRFAQRPRLALAAAGFVAVATLVASLLVVTAPASASDLLVRAERAAVNGSTSFNTYRGTTKGENWLGGDGKRLTVPASYEQKIEFSSPNNVRIDTTATDPSGATGRQQLFFDGKAAWIFVPDAKVAQPIDPRMVLSQSPFAPSTLAGAIESLSQAFNAKQLSDDVVLGRPAHVLELTPKDSAQSGPMAKITTWLDTQTLLQLGADVRDAQGQLLMTWRFVALELNVNIAASEFTFTPSADVRIGQVLPPGATAGMRMELWRQLAAQSGFQLFRPFCGIDGLDEGMPARDQRGVIVLPFAANGSPIVMMQQGPRDAFPALSGENVTIGDVIAIYRVADEVEHLDFERSGTHVHIQAPQPLGRDPLYHLAVSLVPVAKS